MPGSRPGHPPLPQPVETNGMGCRVKPGNDEVFLPERQMNGSRRVQPTPSKFLLNELLDAGSRTKEEVHHDKQSPSQFAHRHSRLCRCCDVDRRLDIGCRWTQWQV